MRPAKGPKENRLIGEEASRSADQQTRTNSFRYRYLPGKFAQNQTLPQTGRDQDARPERTAKVARALTLGPTLDPGREHCHFFFVFSCAAFARSFCLFVSCCDGI